MAIERKDVKVYLDHDLHAQLKAICDIDGVGLGEFIERAVVPVIEKRVHDAIVLSDAIRGKGILLEMPESSGMGRK